MPLRSCVVSLKRSMFSSGCSPESLLSCKEPSGEGEGRATQGEIHRAALGGEAPRRPGAPGARCADRPGPRRPVGGASAWRLRVGGGGGGGGGSFQIERSACSLLFEALDLGMLRGFLAPSGSGVAVSVLGPWPQDLRVLAHLLRLQSWSLQHRLGCKRVGEGRHRRLGFTVSACPPSLPKKTRLRKLHPKLEQGQAVSMQDVSFTHGFGSQDVFDVFRVWGPADLVCFSVPLWLRLPVRHARVPKAHQLRALKTP